MSYKFDPSKQSLSDLFDRPNETKYIIPKYQREYSWKKQQLEEYWKLIDDKDEIFIGTMIFYVEINKKNIKSKEIIDGQQRYLTTIIAAAALRDLFLEEFKRTKDDDILTLAKDTQNDYISRRISGTKEYINYLEPGLSTLKYFNSEIQKFDEDFFKNANDTIEKIKNNNTKEESLIIDAYKYFKDNWIIESKNIGLKNLFSHFKQRLGCCFVIRIEIDTYELAFDIFESVNEKGIRLGVSDLIKNIILRYLPSDPKSQALGVEKWNEMIAFLYDSKISPQEFLRYYWASKYEYISDKQLYKKINLEVKNNMSSNWNLFLEMINKEAQIISSIYNAQTDWIKYLGISKQESFKFIYSINVFKNIKAKTWLVLILCIIRNNDKLKHHKVEYIPVIEKIQKFTFLYFNIMGYPGNWYFNLMWKTAIKIEKSNSKKELSKIFLDLYKEFNSKLDIPEASFIQEFKDIKYKQDSESKFMINLVFTEIEMKKRGIKHVTWNQDVFNIEHILPQDPKKWKLKLSEIKNHLHVLGNLVLIPYALNGRLGNLGCEEKMDILKNEVRDLKILDEIVINNETGKWPFNKIKSDNFYAIEKRQEDLTKLSYEIWVTDFKKKLGF